jgi:undecaprenyl-diphosphatase
VAAAVAGFDRRRAVLAAGSFVPPAIVGLVLERPIERRLGTPRSIALGLLAGSAAMVAADRRALRRGAGRRREDASAADALALGIAQACALMPGASRNGMTLAAARARGFDREAASVLSRHVALPVIVGATALKGARLARRELDPALRAAFAAGVAASFASTLASAWIVARVDRGRSPLPYAAYRAALAAVVLARGHRGHPPPRPREWPR